MTRSQKLSAALEVLDFKLNKQLSDLVKLMQCKLENEQKLQDLVNYQNNYDLNRKMNQTIANVQIQHKLMSKLILAIDAQQQVVSGLEQKVNEKISILQKDRAQNKALEMLIKRYHQQEIQVRNRKEQNETDSQILVKLQSDGVL